MANPCLQKVYPDPLPKGYADRLIDTNDHTLGRYRHPSIVIYPPETDCGSAPPGEGRPLAQLSVHISMQSVTLPTRKHAPKSPPIQAPLTYRILLRIASSRIRRLPLIHVSRTSVREVMDNLYCITVKKKVLAPTSAYLNSPKVL